ncbi:MAG: DNA repair protein RecO [Spirochaetes bacterium]|nr:DNA repair protein RecO [Spirochaetota bacterium]
MESRLTKTDGIVLASNRFGEGHKIVRILTASFGKIEASAFGVRKTKSKFGSTLEPFSHVRLQLYRKGEGTLYTIRDADAIHHNDGIRDDLYKFMAASAVIEPVVRFVETGSDEHGLYRLLSGCLGILNAIPVKKAIYLLSMYEFKFLTEMGYRQQTETCDSCGATVRPEQAYADTGDGFPLCSGCMRTNSMRVEPSVLRFVKWAQDSPLDDARRIVMSPGTLSNLRQLIRFLYRHHFHEDLKSWKHLSETGSI